MADVAHVLIEIDPVRAGEMAQEAMAAATGFDDISTVIATEITYGRVCAGQIEPSEGLPLMRSAADRARAAGDLPALSHALVTVSDALFEIGDYEQSAAAAAEGLPYADHVQVGRRTGALLLANYAEALIALGRWDDADAQLAKAARRYTPGTMALLWLRLRGVLRLARGHDGAEPLITRAVAALGKPFVSPEKRFYLLEMRIAMALATGDPHTAVSTARIAAAEPGLAARARYAWPLLVAAARAATGIDDLQQSLRDAAAPLPRRHPADHAHAAVLTALLDGGPTHWSTAVSACRTDGRPYELAQALLHLAESQAAARPTRAVPAQDGRAHAGPAHAGPAQDGPAQDGPAHAGPAQDGPAHAGPATVDRSAAAASLTEARELAAALGAAPLRADIDTMARRLGLRALVGNNPRGATAPTSPAPAGTEILTAREREVLRLVAEGQSNSRIATSLFISPKTASVHVSRIIAKLDVANRVEAAAVAHRLGLLTD
jgi:DNA-binding CsgD family transcriptional regulator/tetratricopeptide (TPR) repeat protein